MKYRPEILRDGYVYAAQRLSDGLIKIGWTTNPDARLALLDRVEGGICLWGLVPGTKQTEADIHQRWSRFHVHGDWFLDDNELLEAAEDSRLLMVEPRRGLCRFERTAP